MTHKSQIILICDSGNIDISQVSQILSVFSPQNGLDVSSFGLHSGLIRYDDFSLSSITMPCDKKL